MTVLSPLSLRPVFYQGKPIVGAKLYAFDAGTTTPRTVYSNSGATTPIAQPILSDANGNLPAIFVSGGAYRMRAITPTGVQIWDVDGVTADPVAETGSEAVPGLLTGDIVFRYTTGSLEGRVRANGRTIGSASSGASERANADTQALFEYFWTNTTLTVSGGRGLTATADFQTDKTIILPDLRGRAPVGLDDMGSASAARLTGGLFGSGNGTTVGSTGGEAAHMLSLPESPAHAHTAASGAAGAHSHSGSSIGNAGAHNHAITDPGHYHPDAGSGSIVGIQGGGAFIVAGPGSTDPATTGISLAAAPDHTHALTIAAQADHTHTVTVDSAGGGGAHNNMPPFLLGTFYIKL